MTPFESGVEIVLFIEAIVFFVVACVTKQGRWLYLACALLLTMLLVRLVVHLSVEWVP